MHYIIQENVFREAHYDRLEGALKRLGLPYTTVRLFPFIDRIVSLDDIPVDNDFNVDDLPAVKFKWDEPVFCFGAIKMARIARDSKWKPGSMMNSNHDYMVYKNHWNAQLLNHDSKIFKLGDDFGWSDDEVKFIRPTEDTKSFTGQTFTKIEWEEKIQNYLHNYRSDVFNEETLVQVGTPKDIYKEIRCWVVNGKIITASTYRVANEFNINGTVFPEELEYAQSMVDLFQLAEAFVIDICVTDNGFKIVEAGCINCAGFYNADLLKVICAIEDHFNPHPRIVAQIEKDERQQNL